MYLPFLLGFISRPIGLYRKLEINCHIICIFEFFDYLPEKRFKVRRGLVAILNTCKYSISYDDERRGAIFFYCKEEAKTGLYCIYHNNKLLKSYDRDRNRQEIRKGLTEKINDCINTNQDLFCIGYNIPDLKIEGKVFTAAVYFSHAKFNGETIIRNNSFHFASFEGSKFRGKQIDISSNLFAGSTTNFSNSDLHGEDILISNVVFEGQQLLFRRAKLKSISGSIDLSGTKFSTNLIDFSYAEFSTEVGAIYFTGTGFNGQTYFVGTVFSAKGLVLFSGAKFTGYITSFGGTKFLERGVTFTGAHFSNAAGVVGFPDTKFECLEVSFYQTEFYCETQFLRTVFKIGNKIGFDYAKFLKKCILSECLFSGGKVSFIGTGFNGELSFKDTTFSHVIFNEAKFSNTDFTKSKFTTSAEFINCNFGGEIRFNYVEFKEPDKVFLQTSDLSNLSLINTDVTRLVFSENARFGIGSQRFKTYDERKLEGAIRKNLQSEANLGELFALYRNLRENYEYRLRYEEAGQFFIREMELKRNYEEVEGK